MTIYLGKSSPQHGLLSTNDEYMHWYRSITQRWILRDGALMGKLFDATERLYFLFSPEDESSFTREEGMDLVQTMLRMHKEDYKICKPRRVAPQPSQDARISEEQIQVNIPRSRREGQGQGLCRHRTHVRAEDFTVPPMLER